MNFPGKRSILLIDLNDPRRDTRVRILEKAGYTVEVSQNHKAAEALGREFEYDLVLLALHRDKFKEAVDYSDRLQKANPGLPILLLTDAGVYVPIGTLSPSIETGLPHDLIKEIARMLTGRDHIQELQPDIEALGQS
jgi:ActR/RegA family two-component response regulator